MSLSALFWNKGMKPKVKENGREENYRKQKNCQWIWDRLKMDGENNKAEKLKSE